VSIATPSQASTFKPMPPWVTACIRQTR
jgi:hypothetical protein